MARFIIRHAVGFIDRQIAGLITGLGAAVSPARGPTVQVVGLKETEQMLASVMPREARNITRRVVVAIAREVRDDIRKAAPRDDGTLRKAIIHRRQRGRPGVSEAAVFITHGKAAKHNAFYWHMVEFGTVKMPARPYIRPAVMDHRARLQETYRRQFGVELEKELAKIARRTVPGLK